MSTSLDTNPFRRAATAVQAAGRMTPSNTGFSSSQQQSNPHPPPSPSLSSQDRRPSPANDVSSPTSNFARRDPRLDITEDSPPPYTPAPSTVEGEQTLEYGPNRPFQPPPAPPTAPHSAGYPGNHSHSAFLFPPGSHATASPTVQRVVGVLNDLYNATRQQSWHGSTGPPGQFPSGNHGPPPPQNAHPPLNSLPTGPPPLPRSPRPNIEQNGEQQDPAHTPTTTPMAGHPLLRDGNVLIYPQGFTCYKCGNTGFKSFDPTHPCRKCWDRYSKPYRGAVTYAPTSGGQTNFQKPLPHFPGPLQRGMPGGHPGLLGRGMPGGYPGQLSRAASWGGPAGPTGPVSSNWGGGYGRPPPGAVVVRPGDPRIGGRLCWRCDGSGEISMMIFDVSTCPTCQGTGRILT